LIQINYHDSRPIYEKVKDSLRQLILSGALPEGDRLPSVRELAVSLTINPNTIQRAYRELEQEGYIVSVPGKGSFVAQGGGARAARLAELRERLCALAAEEGDAAEREALTEAVFRLAESWKGPEYGRLMLLAQHRHTLELIPGLSREGRERLADWYGKTYPRRKRLPVQDQVFAALKG
jgi:GntR family transcriptional regulator